MPKSNLEEDDDDESSCKKKKKKRRRGCRFLRLVVDVVVVLLPQLRLDYYWSETNDKTNVRIHERCRESTSYFLLVASKWVAESSKVVSN